MGGALYYFLVGMLVGGAAIWFVTYTQFKNISFKWWEWSLMALSLLLVSSIFQHMYSSMSVEMEYQSAFMYLGVFGTLAVILNLIVWRTYSGRKE